VENEPWSLPSLFLSPFVSFLSDGFTRVVTHWAFSHNMRFRERGNRKGEKEKSPLTVKNDFLTQYFVLFSTLILLEKQNYLRC